MALSIKPGADVGVIAIGGRLHTSGDHVTTVEIEGRLDRLEVAGRISATGMGSDAVHTTSEVQGLDSIDLKESHGQTLVRSA